MCDDFDGSDASAFPLWDRVVLARDAEISITTDNATSPPHACLVRVPRRSAGVASAYLASVVRAQYSTVELAFDLNLASFDGTLGAGNVSGFNVLQLAFDDTHVVRVSLSQPDSQHRISTGVVFATQGADAGTDAAQPVVGTLFYFDGVEIGTWVRVRATLTMGRSGNSTFGVHFTQSGRESSPPEVSLANWPKTYGRLTYYVGGASGSTEAGASGWHADLDNVTIDGKY